MTALQAEFSGLEDGFYWIYLFPVGYLGIHNLQLRVKKRETREEIRRKGDFIFFFRTILSMQASINTPMSHVYTNLNPAKS